MKNIEINRFPTPCHCVKTVMTYENRDDHRSIWINRYPDMTYTVFDHYIGGLDIVADRVSLKTAYKVFSESVKLDQ